MENLIEKTESVYYNTLNLVGLKRLPPILFPLVIPIFLSLFMIYYLFVFMKFLFRIFLWAVGFWKCDKCKRNQWIIHDKNRYEYEKEGDKDHLYYGVSCTSCSVEKKLTS